MGKLSGFYKIFKKKESEERILKECIVLGKKNLKLATLLVCILSLAKNDKQTVEEILILLDGYFVQKEIVKREVSNRLKIIQN